MLYPWVVLAGCALSCTRCGDEGRVPLPGDISIYNTVVEEFLAIHRICQGDAPVTREQAVATLRRLAVGLEPDLAGVRRLLERISQADNPECLRAVLTERGAAALLDEEVG